MKARAGIIRPKQFLFESTKENEKNSAEEGP